MLIYTGQTDVVVHQQCLSAGASAGFLKEDGDAGVLRLAGHLKTLLGVG